MRCFFLSWLLLLMFDCGLWYLVFVFLFFWVLINFYFVVLFLVFLLDLWVICVYIIRLSKYSNIYLVVIKRGISVIVGFGFLLFVFMLKFFFFLVFLLIKVNWSFSFCLLLDKNILNNFFLLLLSLGIWMFNLKFFLG